MALHPEFPSSPYAYRFVYVNQEGFEAHRPTTFAGLIETFRGYQG